MSADVRGCLRRRASGPVPRTLLLINDLTQGNDLNQGNDLTQGSDRTQGAQ